MADPVNEKDPVDEVDRKVLANGKAPVKTTGAPANPANEPAPANVPNNRGAKWTDEEIQKLQAEIGTAATIGQIAASHCRTEGAIRSRLTTLAAAEVQAGTYTISEAAGKYRVGADEIRRAGFQLQKQEKAKAAAKAAPKVAKEAPAKKVAPADRTAEETLVVVKEIRDLMVKILADKKK